MQEICSNISRKETYNLPGVIDLFSGCGGLALGFSKASFNITAGIELDQAAVSTVLYNLHWSKGDEGYHICGDIREHDPEIFRDKIDHAGCVVIGGPPCQAYSQIGKGKLRSLGRQHTGDSRGTLFEDFIRFAVTLNAKAVVMENVPESVNYGGLNVPQHVCELLEASGYKAKWSILNAANFGVPQTRERVFVIAVENSLNKDPVFPTPTHRAAYNKQTVLQNRFTKYIECSNFVLPNKPNDDCPEWISVAEAISDLPVLFPDQFSKYRLLKPNVRLPYKSLPANGYQRLMRNWSVDPQMQVSGNCFRYTARDFPIFAKMKPGDDYRNASDIAEEILKSVCRAERIDEYSDPERYIALRKKIVPPYDRDKFFEKWKRLYPDRPAYTLVAHLSVDTYSHIHPWEPRGISLREAARLQSFPDNFIFQCTMGEAFKQVGNAVPPLLSKAIAEAVKGLF